MNPAVQQLASVAAPVVVVIALVGFGLWLFSWVSARAKASHIEQDLPASAVDLGPLVEVPVKPMKSQGLTTAERAKANRAEAARAESEAKQRREKIDREAGELLDKVAAELAAKKAEQTELQSILSSKPEAST